MGAIEIPRNMHREYLNVFGVVAIYIATTIARRPCIVGTTSYLDRVAVSLRRNNAVQFDLVGAYWFHGQDPADRVITRLSAFLPHRTALGFDYLADKVMDEIRLIAEFYGLCCTSHDTVINRIRSAVARVDATIEAAKEGGDMGFFNTAYRNYRVACSDGGNRAINYREALNRLKKILISRALSGAHADIDDAILDEIFVQSNRNRPLTAA